VDESDIGQISEGQPVAFTVQAYPTQPFEGTVQQVRLQSTTMENVVNYTVVVGVDNRAGKLLPGMTATVDFQVQTAEDVLLVPNAALRFRPTAELLNATGSRLTPAESASRSRGDTGAGTLRPSTGAGRPGRGEGQASLTLASLWYLDETGALTTARVRTGISDGINTQVEGPDIREGMQVIAGVLTQGQNGSNSPFAQEQPDRRARGGF
jgi:HlyD family secretion protein